MALPSSRVWSDIAWNGTVFCAIASGGTNVAATSPDGVDWTARTMPFSSDWTALAWNGTVFIAIVPGGSPAAATSPDGITWTIRDLSPMADWTSVAWNGTVFCAIASGGTTASTSPDGITWTTRTLPFSGNWIDIAAKDGVFVAIATGSANFARSTNGITWTQHAAGTRNWRAIAASSSGFVAVATGSATGSYSADGTSFSSITLPASANWYDIAWNGTTFAAVANASTTAATGNATGSSWTLQTIPTGAWVKVAWNGTYFCAIESNIASVISADGVTWTPGIPVPPLYGTPVAPSTLTVSALGTPVAPTTLTVDYPTGTPTAPATLTVTATGTPVAPTTLSVIPATHVPNWTARCIIGVVDVSARLVGQARVLAAEGAARIASVTLLPPSGTIEPLDYVGKTITLDYVLVIGATEVARRLFTGRVDTPAYDPSATLLTLTCTDDLQNIVAGLPRATLDSLIDGRYAVAVQGEISDTWDYAQALMSTVAGSLDATPAGGLRVSAWEPVSTWATFGDADMLYEHMRLTLPQRSTLVNRVDIAFDYRYARLRQRYTTLGWSGTQIDMRPNGWQYPTQQDILGAANGSGWTATLGVFFPAPAAVPYPGGGFIYPPDGAIDMAIIHLTQRHSQTVTEGYAITVTAPESVEANGELPSTVRGALSSVFDGSAWESALDVEPLMPSGGEQDYAPDADRAAADHAIQTLLDQARVKILGTHRSARVSNVVLCNPDIDLDKKIAIATTACTATGKVAQVEHVLDFASGSATTEFSIAISGIGGAGIITPDTLAPPTPPDEATATQDWTGGIPPLFVNTYGVTPYSDNLMGLLLNPPETVAVKDVPGEGTVSYPNPYYADGSYPVQGFRVRMPGVDDADRNPLSKPVVSSYQILVPADPLTFTVP